MQVVRFLSPTGPRLGWLGPRGVVDLVAAAQERQHEWLIPVLCDMRLFLAGGKTLQQLVRAVAQDSQQPHQAIESLRLLAPFQQGSKILAHVVNYFGHDKEAKVKVPDKPFYFQKPGSSVTNPGDPIYAHAVSNKLDHEVELAVVIGSVCRNIPAAQAYEHVAGYTIINDVSYRDIQMNEGMDDLNKSYGKNWTQAKGLDAAAPIGPVLVLADEMPNPYPLDIECRVNGRVRQKASTEDMIYKVPQLIEEASRGMTLYPGDLIATGTCAGGGLGDGVFLNPGDVVECEIERIGILRNQVLRDPGSHPQERALAR
jgi:2-keto-4-pentenoate hydratase/2-oxohepta-3-ene-1,7-dioic acid hydratase in catechol pathway